MPSRFIQRVADVSSAADALLIDQFGTLHDGTAPYPGAVHALKYLRWQNKKIVLLSNSGRRVSANLARMRTLGFPDDLFDLCITSGEVAWRSLRADPPDYLKGPTRALLLARDRSLDILDGFDVTLARDAEDADFVLVAGSEADRIPYAQIWTGLQPALDRGLPAICTNPDFEMIVDGRLYPGAGLIATEYYERGGNVRFFGKPHQSVYREAFAALPDINRGRIIGVGDSLQHDVHGAGLAGIQSLLVLNGLLADKTATQVKHEIARYRHQPDYIATSFR